jgi:hypothetical protein
VRRALGAVPLLVTALVLGNQSAAAADGQIVVTTTLADPSGMAGTLTITGLKAGASYEFADAFEALPRQTCPQAASGGSCEPRLLLGTYEASFSGCTGGSILGGIETIAPGFIHSEPQRTTSPDLLPLQVAAGHNTIRCDYAVRYTGADAPTGSVQAIRNDVWVLRSGMAVAQLVGPEIQASSQPPPPIIPEAPIAVLLPLTGVLSIAVGILVLRRRTPAAG